MRRCFEDADVHTLVLVLERQENSDTRKNTKILTTTSLNQNFVEKEEAYSVTLQDYFSSIPGRVWNILIK